MLNGMEMMIDEFLARGFLFNANEFTALGMTMKCTWMRTLFEDFLATNLSVCFQICLIWYADRMTLCHLA